MSMEILIVLEIVAFILIALVALYVTKYRTAGGDEALIVTGSYLGSKNVHKDESGNRIKIIRGGGTFVFPIFQASTTIKSIIK
ncbi:Flotillin OS=Lysinibacillus sphaericus OX=1421 GN=LS41612_15770 PE=3 SV=1 [Lysinibacillus sphaericus]